MKDLQSLSDIMEILEKQEDMMSMLENQRLKISDLLSQISLLKKKVLEQQQEIVKLNGQIEKLHNSDLQLKEAQKIRQQAMSEAIRYKVRADKDRLDALDQIMKIKQKLIR